MPLACSLQVEYREVVKQVPRPEVQYVDKRVPKHIIEYVEKIVEVPQAQHVFLFLSYSQSSSGGAPEGATTLLHFSSAPDPLFKVSKAPFLTLRVATPSGAPRQAPLELLSETPVCW